jgi:hypothetical protein
VTADEVVLDPTDPKWQYLQGLVRDDGLSITVFSTRKFTFATPERIARFYDRGEAVLGCTQWIVENEPMEETYYVIKKEEILPARKEEQK